MNVERDLLEELSSFITNHGHKLNPVRPDDIDIVQACNRDGEIRRSEKCWDCTGEYFDKPIDPHGSPRTWGDHDHELAELWARIREALER